MHADLEAVVRLWDNVHLAQRLQAERGSCVDARKQTLDDKQRTASALEAARVALDVVRTEERRVMRKLDAYRKRVTTTRTMIDAGKAPDYRLAEQQLRACLQIVDELETEALELMERRDDAEQVFEQAQSRYDRALAAAKLAMVRERDRIPAIDRELEDLDLARPALREGLAREHRAPFKTLLARKRSAIATLKSGACSLCNYGAPSQVVNEIEGHSRVHTCRNCGRFLLPERDETA